MSAKSKKTPKATKAAKQLGPVARVWQLADKLGERAAVLAAAEKEHINPWTARTQWQRWLHRNDTPKAKKPVAKKSVKQPKAKKAPTREGLRQAA